MQNNDDVFPFPPIALFITGIDTILRSLLSHYGPGKHEGCGELPRSLMRQQWPELRYQFLFCYDRTKLIMIKKILPMYMRKIVPKLSWLQHGYICTSWGHVTWLFLLGNTCSNHCNVTLWFVTLNSNRKCNRNSEVSIIILGKHIKINQTILIRWHFENTNYLQKLNCLTLNTTVFDLIFVVIILIRVCFIKLFKSWVQT